MKSRRRGVLRLLRRSGGGEGTVLCRARRLSARRSESLVKIPCIRRVSDITCCGMRTCGVWVESELVWIGGLRSYGTHCLLLVVGEEARIVVARLLRLGIALLRCVERRRRELSDGARRCSRSSRSSGRRTLDERRSAARLRLPGVAHG